MGQQTSNTEDMSKYYAVANGYQTGIFNSWVETEKQVKGYSGAKYKSFKTLPEAQQYLAQNNISDPNPVYYDTNSYQQIFSPVMNNNYQPVMNNNQNNFQLMGGELIVYTDGSCSNKIGGYGYIIVKNTEVVPVSGKVPYYPTTNQVAELYAIYSAISHLLSHYKQDLITTGVIIYTDSMYSIGCLTDWHHNWKRNGWINSKGEKVANKELIQGILNLSTGLKISYVHVKAHNGDKYNEWADRLANEGRN